MDFATHIESEETYTDTIIRLLNESITGNFSRKSLESFASAVQNISKFSLAYIFAANNKPFYVIIQIFEMFKEDADAHFASAKSNLIKSIKTCSPKEEFVNDVKLFAKDIKNFEIILKELELGEQILTDYFEVGENEIPGPRRTA
jgi:hypothetical protein